MRPRRSFGDVLIFIHVLRVLQGSGSDLRLSKDYMYPVFLFSFLAQKLQVVVLCS